LVCRGTLLSAVRPKFRTELGRFLFFSRRVARSFIYNSLSPSLLDRFFNDCDAPSLIMYRLTRHRLKPRMRQQERENCSFFGVSWNEQEEVENRSSRSSSLALEIVASIHAVAKDQSEEGKSG